MNLYESISKSISEKKDKMEFIAKVEEEYKSYVSIRDDLYIKIVGLCPSINQNVDVLDFLEYLYNSVSDDNIFPIEIIETYLISKDYKSKTEDFDNLVSAIMDFITAF